MPETAHRHPARRRRLRALALVTSAVACSTLGLALPAQAAVSPWRGDARFVSIINTGDSCSGRLDDPSVPTFEYDIDGHMQDRNHNPVPGSTWHHWHGNLSCRGKDVLAWAPASGWAQLVIVITLNGRVIANRGIDGNTNYCFKRSAGRISENWSWAGSGGSGSCTAK